MFGLFKKKRVIDAGRKDPPKPDPGEHFVGEDGVKYRIWVKELACGDKHYSPQEWHNRDGLSSFQWYNMFTNTFSDVESAKRAIDRSIRTSLRFTVTHEAVAWPLARNSTEEG